MAQTTRLQAQPVKREKRQKLGRIDIPMLTIILVLLMFGLVILYSASYPSGYLRWGDSYAYIGPQVMYAAVGLVAMFGAAAIDYRIWRKFAWPAMIVAYILLVVVLFMTPYNGAQRWIWLGSGTSRSFQPSEFVKFAVILLFASLIHAHQSRMKTMRYGMLPFIAILGSVSYLLLKEPHLSCTLLVLGIGVSMMFAGGARALWFGVGLIAAGVLLYFVGKNPELLPHAFDRITDWLASQEDVGEMAYQTRQSLIAVGSGGVTGRGIGASRQKFMYLPEMYNDYIFAVLCEELGMIGAIATMLLFLLFLARGLYIALRTSDKFGSMLVVGITVQVSLQAFLHMAVNTNAIPSTGISMPFFSSGGSSLVMLLGQMGILLSVSRGANLQVVRREETEPPAPEHEARPQPQGQPQALPLQRDSGPNNRRQRA